MVAREAGVQRKKHAVFLTHLPGLTYKKLLVCTVQGCFAACMPAGVWCLRAKAGIGFPELELQIGAGLEPRSSSRTGSALNC